jgi:hypothetical protein
MSIAPALPRPGLLVHLIAGLAAAVGVYWAGSGMTSSHGSQPIASVSSSQSRAEHSVLLDDFEDWTTGDIGRIITTNRLSVDALNMSSDKQEVVARVTGSYGSLCALTRQLMQTSGLSIISLSVKRSRHEHMIDATIVLEVAGGACR